MCCYRKQCKSYPLHVNPFAGCARSAEAGLPGQGRTEPIDVYHPDVAGLGGDLWEFRIAAPRNRKLFSVPTFLQAYPGLFCPALAPSLHSWAQSSSSVLQYKTMGRLPTALRLPDHSIKGKTYGTNIVWCCYPPLVLCQFCASPFPCVQIHYLFSGRAANSATSRLSHRPSKNSKKNIIVISSIILGWASRVQPPACNSSIRRIARFCLAAAN